MKINRRNFLSFAGVSSAAFLSGRMDFNRPHPGSNYQNSSYDDVWIELKLENMGWNLEQIRKFVKVPIMAVIKCNGYGHGLVEVGRYLDQKKIDALMVVSLPEALKLREAGVSCPVHNFGPLHEDAAEILINKNISQSIFTEKAQKLNAAALKIGKRIDVHIHVDTGMARMGIPYYEALPYIKKVAGWKGLRIKGISTAMSEDNELDKEQIKRFEILCKHAESEGISLGIKHAVSTTGIFSQRSSYLDMVRPGLLFFGYYPSQEVREKFKEITLKPVLQLKSRVAVVRNLRPGDPVSYNKSYVAKTREKIAVIPVGYSNGYPYNAQGKTFVLINGERCPVVAYMSANHMEVLLKPDSNVSMEDEVVLLGTQGKEEITADDIAEWTGVSSYKVMIWLNPLMPRIIL
ncbi:MAG: alanine racemase [Candidatus Aminicenantes bacterium]|jgi:alanine racemase|nr:alanine racemase [Candidatus Aminicenantes bacterium]